MLHKLSDKKINGHMKDAFVTRKEFEKILSMYFEKQRAPKSAPDTKLTVDDLNRIANMVPRIPGDRGDDGDDYCITQKDYEEIAKKAAPQAAKMVKIPDPIPGPPGDIKFLTAREMLNFLRTFEAGEEKIPLRAIEDGQEMIDELEKAQDYILSLEDRINHLADLIQCFKDEKGDGCGCSSGSGGGPIIVDPPGGDELCINGETLCINGQVLCLGN